MMESATKKLGAVAAAAAAGASATGGGAVGATTATNTHAVPQSTPTLAQVALAAMWLMAVLAWAGRQAGHRLGLGARQAQQEPDKESLVENGSVPQEEAKDTDSTPAAPAKPQTGPPTVSLDKALSQLVVFGALMAYFYACDYVKVFPQGERVYQRDLFLFLVFLLFLVGCVYTLQPCQDKILNRDQTEEWKGWMQVMFVWYHYYAAKEWYNWIRVYIACYVWMTGFGNFSFFWVRGDYSLFRLGKMLFRLNFLVVFVMLTTNNSYMLYYICAMHTYWFLTVYVFMRVLSSWNKDPTKMAVKFVAYACANAAIFEIPGACATVFRPLSLVLGLDDGKGDIMHEWAFRAGLDHWACFVGMLCAYNYPHYEAFMAWLDGPASSPAERRRQMISRVLMAVGAMAAGCIWYFGVMNKDKYSYNAFHPYTSGVPILAFIVLRNLHPALRRRHVALFAWLGKITLETYLSQLHIYLLANARTLLVYLPDLPLLNFSLASLVYLAVSHQLFRITNDVSNWLMPPKPRS